MSWLFDFLSGGSTRPLRRTAQFKATVNAAGEPIIELIEGEATMLSPE